MVELCVAIYEFSNDCNCFHEGNTIAPRQQYQVDDADLPGRPGVADGEMTDAGAAGQQQRGGCSEQALYGAYTGIKSSDIGSDWFFYASIPQEPVFRDLKAFALSIAVVATVIDVARAALRLTTPRDKAKWNKVENKEDPAQDQPGWKYGKLYARLGFADTLFDDVGSLVACFWFYTLDDGAAADTAFVFNLVGAVVGIVVACFYNLHVLAKMATKSFAAPQQRKLQGLIDQANEEVKDLFEGEERIASMQDSIKSIGRIYQSNQALADKLVTEAMPGLEKRVREMRAQLERGWSDLIDRLGIDVSYEEWDLSSKGITDDDCNALECGLHVSKTLKSLKLSQYLPFFIE
jgi:hypothetical protein